MAKPAARCTDRTLICGESAAGLARGNNEVLHTGLKHDASAFAIPFRYGVHTEYAVKRSIILRTPCSVQ